MPAGERHRTVALLLCAIGAIGIALRQAPLPAALDGSREVNVRAHGAGDAPPAATNSARCAAVPAITHPDEVFQGLEQAHVLAFGYGMTPMEYTRTSAMRSHALPWLYSLPMRAAEAIGADYHRVGLPGTLLLHRVVTGALLPAAVFAYTRAMLMARPDGSGGASTAGKRAARHVTFVCVVAAALAAFDPVMIGIGRQTLANGFWAPLTLAIGAWLRVLASAPRAAPSDTPAAAPLHFVRADCLALGVTSGLLLWARPDAAITLAVAAAGVVVDRLLPPLNLVVFAASAAVGTLCGGAIGAGVDTAAFGRRTSTLANWFSYNIWEGRSASDHGASPTGFYLEHVLPAHGSMRWAALAAACLALALTIRAAASAALRDDAPLPARDGAAEPVPPTPQAKRAQAGPRGRRKPAARSPSPARSGREPRPHLSAGVQGSGSGAVQTSTALSAGTGRVGARGRSPKAQGRRAVAPATYKADPEAVPAERSAAESDPLVRALMRRALHLAWQAAAVAGVYSAVPHKEVRFVHDAYVLLLAFLGTVIGTTAMAVAECAVAATQGRSQAGHAVERARMAGKPNPAWELMTAATIAAALCGGALHRVDYIAMPVSSPRMGGRSVSDALCAIGAIDTRCNEGAVGAGATPAASNEAPTACAEATGVVVLEGWFFTAAWTALHRRVPITFFQQGRMLPAQPAPWDNPWWDAGTAAAEGSARASATNVFTEFGLPWGREGELAALRDMRNNWVVLPPEFVPPVGPEGEPATASGAAARQSHPQVLQPERRLLNTLYQLAFEPVTFAPTPGRGNGCGGHGCALVEPVAAASGTEWWRRDDLAGGAAVVFHRDAVMTAAIRAQGPKAIKAERARRAEGRPQ